MNQNSQKTLVDEFTEKSEIMTGTIELDLSSYDELKARKVASDFVNHLNSKNKAAASEPEADQETSGEETVGERRRHGRIASALPARAYTVLSDAPFSNEPTSGFIVNLSLTGLALVAESDRLARGDVLEIEILAGNSAITISALVVKRNPVLTTAVPQFYYGLRIIKMSPNALTTLESFLGYARE